jgi:hypothetical protein
MEKKIKDKKCKECGTIYTPFNSLQQVCSPKCASILAEKKVWKKKKAELIDKTRTRTDWLKLLQIETNKLIRKIDYGNTCISCGCLPKKPQAGHYHSTQANPTLRFNLFNIWLQCYRCNEELSANIIGYNKGLKEEFTPKLQMYVEEFMVQYYKYLKLDINNIKEYLNKTRKALKEIPEEKRNNLKRLELRQYYLDYIGIYK